MHPYPISRTLRLKYFILLEFLHHILSKYLRVRASTKCVTSKQRQNVDLRAHFL